MGVVGGREGVGVCVGGTELSVSGITDKSVFTIDPTKGRILILTTMPFSMSPGKLHLHFVLLPGG